MDSFNFSRANIKTVERKHRIEQNKINKTNIKRQKHNLINPFIQKSEIELFKTFWSYKEIKYDNTNWIKFLKN